MEKWIIVCFCCGLGAQHTWQEDRPSFDNIVDTFIEESGLQGATVAILEDDRLVYAAGKGNIRKHSALPETLLPILDMSKLITAVAILQLQQNGRLHLDDKVFGQFGILYHIKPTSGRMDTRLHHITVRHLLSHTAGWDESLKPLYDPTINPLFVKSGYEVVNIAKEMGLFGIPNQDDIIHFMINQNVTHQPGTVRKHSNFGYTVLGRIIEEVSGLTYEDFVRRNILERSGMWKTRIGPQQSQTYQSLHPQPVSFNEDWFNIISSEKVKKGYIPLGDESIKSLYDSVPPEVLDSTLGWHSTAYDMARFFTALMKQENSLLNPETREFLLLSNQIHSTDSDQYDSMAFRVEGNGVYWQYSQNYDIAITQFLYHKPSVNLFPIPQHTTDMTLMFLGVSQVNQEKLMQFAENILQPSTATQPNHYLNELADLNNHGTAVRYHISEHKLLSYVEAMRIAGYYPIWLHANNYKQETRFTAIFKLATKDGQLNYDVTIFGDIQRAKNYIRKGINLGYEIQLMQTYKSKSHHGNFAHLTVMIPVQKPMACIYDLDIPIREYLSIKKDTNKEGFIPIIQTVEHRHSNLTASFLLNQMTDDASQLLMTKSKTYHNLTLHELSERAKENADLNYFLHHLDTHSINGQNHFSAIFHEGTLHNWFLEIDGKEEKVKRDAHKWQSHGLEPRLLVSYVKDTRLHYVTLWAAP